MKNIQFLFVLLLIFACSGTKQTFDKTTKVPIEVLIINKDSIIKIEKNTTDIESIETTNLESNSLKNETETKNDSIEFNQILTKRFYEQHELWDELLKKYVSNEGNVNYNEFKKAHKNLLGYITFLQNSKPTEKTTSNAALAYWINAYNAMTIDLILRHYPVKSIKDIKDPWQQRYWKLGEKWYNLDDIEHQILRKMDEPRIHFAIVCASVSCPKLSNEAFTSENLEAQLTKATKDFLNDKNRNSISEDKLELSKIFQWFTSDFKQNGGLINFLNRYSGVKISEKAKKSFKDYNWDLND